MIRQNESTAYQPPLDGPKGDYKQPGDGSKGDYKQPGDGPKDFCGTVFPKTLPICENVAYPPQLSPTPVFAKIPVILAERTVQVDLEAKIKLAHPAIEIKRIRKQLFLTQCKLLPRTGKLFLSGYVRKNIEYATAKCGSGECVAGDIKHETCNVFWDCVTSIPYELGAYPVFSANIEPTLIQTFDPKAMGASQNEQDYESVQYFNEKIFCELVSVRFDEVDIAYDDKKHIRGGWDDEYEFSRITEKLTMFITFKLLQYQQVKIPSSTNLRPANE